MGVHACMDRVRITIVMISESVVVRMGDPCL